ncbi:acyl-CoA synthetase short-chain family member 3, mitochondrial-like [Vespa crabro]|uniref:acyl-CoA synthetase short-chain family member 3, mitochondrial-like n=1 Tax=Vespa crabro TaxID=7445 RepID=UPI001F0084E5|nr:acyl-CoA synthetase short-chain family member 3, mitochondrial-like [Vespa crabro]
MDKNDNNFGSYENHSAIYRDAFKRSLENPEEFWAEVGKLINWFKPWNKVLDNFNEPFTKWFVGGELNACYNAVDRHVDSGNGEKTAIIYDSPQISIIRKVTYNELLEKTSLLASALADIGVSKGNKVIIYMPLIPETIITISAVARLGAIHSVVFGGFAAKELANMINHAKPKVVVIASCGLEPNKIITYAMVMNDALKVISVKTPKCIIFQRKNIWTSPLSPDQYDWKEILSKAKAHSCVPVEANDPLY